MTIQQQNTFITRRTTKKEVELNQKLAELVNSNAGKDMFKGVKMNNYIVYGNVNVNITIRVEANSREAAIQEAYNQLYTLNAYDGNQMVGTDLEKASVSCDDKINWTEAYLDDNIEAEENEAKYNNVVRNQ